MSKEYWDKVWSLQRSYLNKNKETVPDLPWDIGTHDKNLELVLDMLKPQTVLELGCGTGNDARYMEENNISVTALDISKYAIEKAQSYSETTTIDYQCVDFMQYSTTKKFHIVYDRGYIHNQPKYLLASIFHKIYHSLEDNGYCVIIAGNYNDDSGPGTGTKPTPLSLKIVEHFSIPYFKIKSVNEIVFQLNSNFIDGVGWIFVLEKRNTIDKNILNSISK